MKNLGVIIIIIAAVILVVCGVTGNVNSNAINFGSVVLIIVGLIVHIMVNKRKVE